MSKGKALKGAFRIILVLLITGFTSGSSAQDNIVRHHVQPLETFYSLSVKYQVSIGEIKAVNPGLAMPRAGEYINIPVRVKETETAAEKDCSKLKKSGNALYDIALLIPLYLEQTLDSGWAESLDPNLLDEINPFRFIQFYQGFMLAADSMHREGMNIKIHVYDVDHQPDKIKRVIADPDFRKMDLIVGPFLKNSFTEVASLAREYRIPIVNPFSARQDILSGNPFVFKITPSPESQPALLGKLIRRDFRDYNVIIYTANKFQGTGLIGQVKEEVEKSLDPDAPPVKMIDYASDSIKGFLEFASETRPNLIIVYSENEAMPTALLSKLNAVKSNYPVTVIGMPEWDKFNNLESGYLLNMNSHIFMSSFIDYDSEGVKSFIRRYRYDYMDEPQAYAYTGFSTGFYFLQGLFRYGEDFISCLSNLKISLPQNQFHFIKQEGGGFENIYWNVMLYSDYRLINRSVSSW